MMAKRHSEMEILTPFLEVLLPDLLPPDRTREGQRLGLQNV